MPVGMVVALADCIFESRVASFAITISLFESDEYFWTKYRGKGACGEWRGRPYRMREPAEIPRRNTILINIEKNYGHRKCVQSSIPLL